MNIGWETARAGDEQDAANWSYDHVDELLAENEQLRRSAGTLDELLTQLKSELTETEQALAAAEDEIELLRDGLVRAGRQLAATEEYWQAEIERLRAENQRANDYYEWCGDCGEARSDIPRCTVCVIEYPARQAKMVK